MVCVFFLMGNLYGSTSLWIFLVGSVAGLVIFWLSFDSAKKAAKVVGGLILLTTFALSYMHQQTAFSQRAEYMDTVQDGECVTVWGHVYKKEKKNKQFIFYLDKCSFMQGNEISACNHIIIYSDSDLVSIGDSVKLLGQLKIFEKAKNEGGFDRCQFYYAQGIDFAVSLKKIQAVKKGKTRVAEGLYRLRTRMVEVINHELSAPDSGILEAMLYGDKNELEEEIKALYLAAGIAHILSISGLHISIIGMGLYKLLRRLRMGFAASSVIAILFSYLYGMMTGMSIPTQRAIGMLIIALLAQVLGRTNDLLNTLGGIVMMLVVSNPFIMGYSGIWFAVMAIVGICYVGKRLSEILISEKLDRRSKRYKCIYSVLVSTGIQLSTIPVLSFYYYEVSLYSLVINLIVLPMLSTVILLGLAGSVIGLFSLKAGSIIVYPAGVILDIYTIICEIINKLPYSQLVVGKPSVEKIVLYYFFLVSVLELFYRIRCRCDSQKSGNAETTERYREAERTERDRKAETTERDRKAETTERYRKAETTERGRKAKITKRSRNAHNITCNKMRVAVLASLLLIIIYGIRPQKGRPEIDFIDVGQGDCSYFYTESGKSFMVDGGSASEKELAKYTLVPFLKSKGISRIHGWIISHGDKDHTSGIIDVMESGIRIDNLIISKQTFEDRNSSAIIQKAKEKGIKIMIAEVGKTISDSSFTISFLAPLSPEEEDINDSCLVFRLENDGLTAMFAGDISDRIEEQLVEKYGSLKGGMLDVNIYKVNHHGSKYSSSDKWLNALSADTAVISCGKNNQYGHPHARTLGRLEAAESTIYRTDELGEIIITISNSGEAVVEEYMSAVGGGSKHGAW